MAAKQEQLDAVYTQMVERDLAFMPIRRALTHEPLALIGEIAQRNVDRRAEQ